MLLCGGTIVLWDAFSSSAFWDRVDRYDATVTLILSVMIDWLTDKPRRETDQENPLKLVSLQPMPDNCVDIAERFSLEILISGYGQTETGSPIFGLINAGANHAGTPEGYRYGTGPAAMLDRAKEFGIPVVEEPLGDRWMGKPMEPNVKVTILDNRDKERPPGETGELAVRPNRPSVILDSYYNRPEQTLAAMDNFWFHTGDLVRCDENGHFYFVDRMANVIRRRGENISPSRIQDTALEYGVVDAAVAFPVPAQAGGEDEIALVVASRGDDDVVGKAVREHLAAELPEFMVPAYVTLRVTLPTTSTNKVAVSTVREEFLADHPDFD
jgi:crotonobetaine/carnitine-CoA ligase